MVTVLNPPELGLLVNAASHPIVNRWLARGDGVAVYQNVAFDSAGFGHRVFLSYGSPAAQIESTTPPEGCPVEPPGCGGAWKYRLESVCAPGSAPIPAQVTAEREIIDEREAAEDAAAARKAKRAGKARR